MLFYLLYALIRGVVISPIVSLMDPAQNYGAFVYTYLFLFLFLGLSPFFTYPTLFLFLSYVLPSTRFVPSIFLPLFPNKLYTHLFFFDPFPHFSPGPLSLVIIQNLSCLRHKAHLRRHCGRLLTRFMGHIHLLRTIRHQSLDRFLHLKILGFDIEIGWRNSITWSYSEGGLAKTTQLVWISNSSSSNPSSTGSPSDIFPRAALISSIRFFIRLFSSSISPIFRASAPISR